jgi:hypothetical protein
VKHAAAASRSAIWCSAEDFRLEALIYSASHPTDVRLAMSDEPARLDAFLRFRTLH